MKRTKRNLRILLTILLFIVQILDIQGQSPLIKNADSLFLAKNYSEASNFYEELLVSGHIDQFEAYRKLAYMAEENGEFPKAIYYLFELYEVKPSDLVFNKITELATQNNYLGYEKSEINFLFTFFKQNSFLVISILLALSAAVFIYFLGVRKSKKSISKRLGLVYCFFVLLFLLAINFSERYRPGIIQKNNVFLRKEASFASEVIQTIQAGNKVNVIGKTDIWYQILFNREIAYVKESDIWVVKSQSTIGKRI